MDQLLISYHPKKCGRLEGMGLGTYGHMIRDGCLFGVVGLLIFIGGKINPSISLDGCNQLKLQELLLKDGAWRRLWKQSDGP